MIHTYESQEYSIVDIMRKGNNETIKVKPNDCVFTVEYSVRSAMMAVYGLMGLDKKVTEIYPSQYDVRVLMNATKACLGLDHLDLKALPLGALLKGSELEKLI